MPCGAYHVAMTYTLASSLLVCAAAAADISDAVEFDLSPSNDGGLTVDGIVNSKSTFGAPMTSAGTIVMTSDPEFFDVTSGNAEVSSDSVAVSLRGTTTQGGCSLEVNGASIPFPAGEPYEGALNGIGFDTTKFVNGTQTIHTVDGWVVTVTETP